LTTSRSTFLFGALGAAVAGSTRAARAVSAGAARPGSYCAPLAKGVAGNTYDFKLDLLDGEGKVFRLADLRGSAVWLNFFASWCGDCVEESGRVVQLAEHYKPYGLTTIGIDVQESPQRVRDYRDRYRISYPIALDAKGSVYAAFGFNFLPTQLFFDRSGHITCLVADNLSLQAMDNEIAVALGGRSIPIVSSSAAPAATAAP